MDPEKNRNKFTSHKVSKILFVYIKCNNEMENGYNRIKNLRKF